MKARKWQWAEGVPCPVYRARQRSDKICHSTEIARSGSGFRATEKAKLSAWLIPFRFPGEPRKTTAPRPIPALASDRSYIGLQLVLCLINVMWPSSQYHAAKASLVWLPRLQLQRPPEERSQTHQKVAPHSSCQDEGPEPHHKLLRT